jgi:hypothetical protein
MMPKANGAPGCVKRAMGSRGAKVKGARAICAAHSGPKRNLGALQAASLRLDPGLAITSFSPKFQGTLLSPM